MVHLGEFDKTDDAEGASIIRSSCISCLAHLADLYHFVGGMQPSARATMNGLCDATLENLGNLTRDLKLEEVTYYDLLLRVSDSHIFLTWKLADALCFLEILDEGNQTLRFSNQQPLPRGGRTVVELEGDSSGGVRGF